MLPKTTVGEFSRRHRIVVLASFPTLVGRLVMACAVNAEKLSAELLGTVAERLVAR